MKRTFFLTSRLVRRAVAAAIQSAPDGYSVTIAPVTRTSQQNAMLWGLLTTISREVEWDGRHLSPEDWKTLFSALLRQQDVVAGIDGGLVVLGLSTSKLTKREFGDLIDLILAFCSDRGIEVGAEISPEALERAVGAYTQSEGHREVAA
jgi:hypothetical protein